MCRRSKEILSHISRYYHSLSERQRLACVNIITEIFLSVLRYQFNQRCDFPAKLIILSNKSSIEVFLCELFFSEDST